MPVSPGWTRPVGSTVNDSPLRAKCRGVEPHALCAFKDFLVAGITFSRPSAYAAPVFSLTDDWVLYLTCVNHLELRPALNKCSMHVLLK